MKLVNFLLVALVLVSGVFAQPTTTPWLKSFYGGVLYTASMDTATINKGVVGHDASLWSGAVCEWPTGPGIVHTKVFGDYQNFKSHIFYQLKTNGTTLRAGYLSGNGFWFRPNPVSDQNHFLPPSISAIPTLLGLGVVASNDLFSLGWHYGGVDSSIFNIGLQWEIFGATMRAGGYLPSRGDFSGALFRIISKSLNVTLLAKREAGIKTYTGTLVVSTHGLDPYGFVIHQNGHWESWEVGVTKTILGCSWSPYIGATIGPAYNWSMVKGGSLCFFVQIFFYK
ncbi:hypothetical protein A3H03_02940 [Candidatus Kuenenbacteria bacterium RIFCSPLOWO2_12_FULL_42_13]|uniref:Uncharacterized protein n=1 Tax=Candidatus Kuenenbacteria bacterium RIFCSPLOWO2_12_FULL_42_13 TaxID=1798565 RepID=A0A1F6G0H9_9BACT|nr:MAG: hypothetical protein A3H03_02940 [Candidatus Kuenenbacteria bacterium RIFCSPLOWO2_12_FULL_42_13]